MGSSRWWLDDWMDPHSPAMAARLYFPYPSSDDVRHEVRRKPSAAGDGAAKEAGGDSCGAGRIWRRRRQRRLGFFLQWRRLTATFCLLLSIQVTHISRICSHISQNTSILHISVLIPKRNFRKKKVVSLSADSLHIHQPW